MRPLCIDLFCGLGGWAEGFLAEGYRVIGFDIERHVYGPGEWYPADLVLQDVTTLHGRAFTDAAVIVASPPCQAYSYRAMPWKRAKALPPPDNTLFEACFRIQREACEAAGRRIPLIVENVCGAQKWVGRAAWHYGSYYLWGDVPAVMPSSTTRAKGPRPGRGRQFCAIRPDQIVDGEKGTPHKPNGHWTNPDENGTKQRGSGRAWFAGEGTISRTTSSKSPARQRASALIAKIPFKLSRHIAAVYR